MKKGVTDLIFIPIMILVLVIAVFLASIVLSQFLEEFGDTIEGFTVISSISEDLQGIADTLDYFLPIFIVGLGIAMVAISFLVNAHPLYYILSIIVLFTGVLTSAVVSNVLAEFNLGTSSYTVALLPITKSMISYIPVFFIGIAIMTVIAFFGKFGTAGGGNAV